MWDLIIKKVNVSLVPMKSFAKGIFVFGKKKLWRGNIMADQMQSAALVWFRRRELSRWDSMELMVRYGIKG